MKKSFVLLIAVTIILAALAGCGETGGVSTEKEKTAEESAAVKGTAVENAAVADTDSHPAEDGDKEMPDGEGEQINDDVPPDQMIDNMDMIAIPEVYLCWEQELDKWKPTVRNSDEFWEVISCYVNNDPAISERYALSEDDMGASCTLEKALIENAAYACFPDFDGTFPSYTPDPDRADLIDVEKDTITVGYGDFGVGIKRKSYEVNDDRSLDSIYTLSYFDEEIEPYADYRVHMDPNPNYNKHTDYFTYYYMVSRIEKVREYQGAEQDLDEEQVSSYSEYFTDEQLDSIRRSFGIPDSLSVEPEIGEPYYWDGGDMDLIQVDFYHDGEYVAGAAFELYTENMVRNIYMFDKEAYPESELDEEEGKEESNELSTDGRLDEMDAIANSLIQQYRYKDLERWEPSVKNSSDFWSVIGYYGSFGNLYGLLHADNEDTESYDEVDKSIIDNAAYACFSDYDGTFPAFSKETDTGLILDVTGDTVTITYGNAGSNAERKNYEINEDQSLDVVYTLSAYNGELIADYRLHMEPNPDYDKYNDHFTYYYTVSNIEEIENYMD